MKKHIYESDYSSDFMRWSEIYEQIKDIKIRSHEPKLELLQNKIIKDGDAALAYYFACDIGYKNYKMQNVILKSKSSKYGILFAQNINNADILALQNMILETKDIKYICKFARYIPGADIRKIESIVLAEKNLKKSVRWAHMLIKHVKGISLRKFKKIIIQSRKPRYLFELTRHIKNKKELDLIQQLIIESKSPTYIRMFAEQIESADIEKLEQAILDLHDINAAKKFAIYVKRSKMRNFVIMF